MATRYEYGRKIKGPGAPPKHVKRSAFAYAPGTESYNVVDGVVGKPTSVQGARVPYTNRKLRLRRLPCGHGVFMLRGQFPDAETVCIQCEQGKPIR